MRNLIIAGILALASAEARAYSGSCWTSDPTWCWLPSENGGGDQIASLVYTSQKITVRLAYNSAIAYEFHHASSTDGAVNGYEKHTDASYRNLLLTLSNCLADKAPVSIRGYWRSTSRLIGTEFKIFN